MGEHLGRTFAAARRALAEARFRLRWERRWQAAAASLLLVTGGTISWQLLSSGGGAGGGNAPREVGQRLAAALENGDLLGVVDLWHPDERGNYRDLLGTTQRTLTWNGVLAPGAELADLDGVEITIDNLDIDPDQVDQDTWNLRIGAELTMDVDTDQLLASGDRNGTRRMRIDDELLTVVRHSDGKWYLSLAASIGERLLAAYPGDIDPVAAAGASTPEQAARAFLSAVADHDLRRMLAALDPVTAGALQRRAGNWTSIVADELWGSNTWQLSSLELGGGEADGQRSTVAIESVTLLINAGTRDAVTIEATADSCYRAWDRFTTETFCADDIAADAAQADLPPGMLQTLFETDNRVLVLRKRDGLWYVDLTASVTQLLGLVAGQAGPAQLTGLLLG